MGENDRIYKSIDRIRKNEIWMDGDSHNIDACHGHSVSNVKNVPRDLKCFCLKREKRR